MRGVDMLMSSVQGTPDMPVRRTVLGTSDVSRTVRFDVAPNMELPVHSAPRWVHFVVLAGEGRFLSGEGEGVPARAGDFKLYAPNMPHGLAAGPAGFSVVAVIVQA